MLRLPLSRFFVLPAAVLLMCCLIDQPTAHGQQVSAATAGEAPTWYRQKFQVSGFQRKKVELLVASAGTTCVYVNGQVLATDYATTDRPLLWDVTQILRNGPNCLSVSVASAADKATVSAVIRSDAELKTNLSPWKSTTANPPVGWEQTDFNDRDWKPAAVLPQEFSIEAPVQLTWQRTADESHMASGAFRFHNNDHVILLGGTFIERAQQFGDLESALVAAGGSTHVTFRNLGWSADTVFADSRGIFDSPQKGYHRMVEQVRAEKPTVIMVCYGQNEAMSFDHSEAGRVRFRNQLAVLHRDLSSTGAQIVYLSPHPFLQTAAPLPDASDWNARLREFTNTVQEFAGSNEVPFVDLFSGFQTALLAVEDKYQIPSADAASETEVSPVQSRAWTDNGMHWNSTGYRLVASILSNRLFGTELQSPTININTMKKSVVSKFGTVQNIRWTKGGKERLSFDFQPTQLSPLPLRLRITHSDRSAVSAHTTAATSRTPVPFSDCIQNEIEAGRMSVCMTPQVPQYENLRQLTMKKNELYFHRWRPQNITYLFGFRKHEQGNNASDIAKFDPLIDSLEQQIFESAQPSWQTITLSVQD